VGLISAAITKWVVLRGCPIGQMAFQPNTWVADARRRIDQREWERSTHLPQM
jgi:hypothetical protein